MQWKIATMLLAIGLLTAATPIDAEKCTRANGCEFWDNDYHEYILNDWDTAELDVLIIPPASPYALRDISTIEKSVQAWDDGIQQLGASWLTDNLQIRQYTVGYDPIPWEALNDPEIVIISSEHNPFLLFGIGYALPWMACLDGYSWASPVHQHDGSYWSVWQEDCENLGNTCFVVNTSFLFGGKNRMYDLNSHEFGHCLGIGHVGDALDFDAKNFPAADIMSYQYDPSQVHCVSNLNVRSIEGTFGKVLGQPSSTWLDSGDYYHMSPGKYTQVSCMNP